MTTRQAAWLVALVGLFALGGCSSSDSTPAPAGGAGAGGSAGAAGTSGTGGSAGSGGGAGTGGSVDSGAGGSGGAAGEDADVDATQDQEMEATADAPSEGGAKTITVQVGQTGMTFTPVDATISVGDTVHWVFAGAFHTVTSGAGCTPDDKFCSPGDTNCATAATSPAGATYDHTFTAEGSYPYFCRTHCALGMKGTITVNP